MALVDITADAFQKIGIKVDESVHFSTVVVCADSEVDYTDRLPTSTLRAVYSRVKAVVLVLATFAMQIILIYMIHKMTPHFRKDPYGEYCQMQKGFGANAAVCNSDKMGNLAAVVAKTNTQFELQPGEWFGIVAMTLYIAACCSEAQSIINFGGLLFLPDPEDLGPEDDENEDLVPSAPVAQENWFVEGFWEDSGPKAQPGSLVTLSCWIKVVVFGIAALRTAVIIALLVVGLRFLATTDDLKDFVLNSLALVFVFEVDELAFMVLVPLHQRNKTILMDQPAIVDNMPGQCSIFQFFKIHILYSDVFTFIAVILFTYISLNKYLYKFQEDAKIGLCIMGCTDYTECSGFVHNTIDLGSIAKVVAHCNATAAAA